MPFILVDGYGRVWETQGGHHARRTYQQMADIQETIFLRLSCLTNVHY
jgi:hypothetical protein